MNWFPLFFFLALNTSAGDFVPYFHGNPNQKLVMGWRSSDRGSPDQVQFFQEGSAPTLTKVRLSDSFNTVRFQAPTCQTPPLYYSFVSGKVVDTTTSPVPNLPCTQDSHERLSFQFVSDTQENRKTLEISQKISSLPGSLVVHAGDMVQTGSDISLWTELLQKMTPFSAQKIIVSVPGNHEYRNFKSPVLWTLFSQIETKPIQYDFWYGSMHFILFDSNFSVNPQDKEAQMLWLVTQLRIPAVWKIVVLHHAPYSSGLSNTQVDWGQEYLDLREFFVPLFEKHGVNMVLAGHSHLFERSVKSGITYLTAGPAGGKMGVPVTHNPYSVVKKMARTYSHLEFDPSQISGETFDETGASIDDFVLRK